MNIKSKPAWNRIDIPEEDLLRAHDMALIAVMGL